MGARLEAAEAVTPFLNAVFALHDRLRPYYKYLEWKLNAWPLTRFTLPPEEFVQSVIEILENGNTPAQQKLLIHLEKLATAEGYGEIFAGWV